VKKKEKGAASAAPSEPLAEGPERARPGAAQRGPSGDAQRLPLNEVLLPFAPILYIAWADGALTAEEIADIRTHVHADEALHADVRDAISPWLDPDAPPDAEELRVLLSAIHNAGDALDADARTSLAGLGVAIAANARGSRPAARSAIKALGASLRVIEKKLGVVGGEAARSLFGEDATRSVNADPAADLSLLDPAALNQFLDDDHRDLRQKVLGIITSPSFAYLTNPTLPEYREQVRNWVKVLADNGVGGLAFPSEFGGNDDGTQMIAVFETLAFHDLSMLVKFGVHFGLFGGSVFLLGTRRHHEAYLRDIATMKLPGCFAMTEYGHGSNVRDLQTTAVYDNDTGEFIIHTPTEQARKEYIGNAALHARMAVVFAQLIVGGASHGVHAILVPIRDDAGNVLDGIRIEDCGLKEGLNGVDNGRIWFNAVRVPRENLLNRFGDVSEGGTYSSPITNPTRRFFTTIGTLVAGRVSIAAASVNAAKSGLTIATRYTSERRQFGPEGATEQPVLDYRAMQRRIMPAIASTIAMDIAMKDLVRRFGERSDESAREIEALAAAMKALASQHALDTLLMCRQACGGNGYMAENRLSTLLTDTDVFTTFEGANDVLLQLVARGMLTEYKEQFGDMNVWGAVRWVTKRAASSIADLNPVAPRRTDEDHLRDPEFHRDAFHYREDRLLQSLARRLRQRIENGQDSFVALNECQDHALAAARAWGERYILECFQEAVGTAQDPGVRSVLDRLSALFALERIDADRAWFLEAGFLETGKSKAVRNLVLGMCAELRPDAVAIVNGFGIPDVLLAAPIATG
jgi:acyl-CoA oxidase